MLANARTGGLLSSCEALSQGVDGSEGAIGMRQASQTAGRGLRRWPQATKSEDEMTRKWHTSL